MEIDDSTGRVVAFERQRILADDRFLVTLETQHEIAEAAPTSPG